MKPLTERTQDFNQVDEWAAKECGIELYTSYDNFDSEVPNSCFINGNVVQWTLSDSRCREIVREHFELRTECLKRGEWVCSQDRTKYDYTLEHGSTIAEAEIACITAIYEASR